MKSQKKLTRRKAITTGMTLLSAGAGIPSQVLSDPKALGETRVIYFGGDYIHNGVGQERYLRQTFSNTDWNILFAQASRFITPEVLAHADLLMMNRVGDFDAQGFSTAGLVGKRPDPDPFLTPEMEHNIIDNVINRGMGFIALHATAGNADNVDLMHLLGIKPFKSGAILQPVRFHDFNGDHPITADFSEFELDYDENLSKEIVDHNVVPLLKCTGLIDGSVSNGGWCVKRGKGRVVVLMAGHTNDAYKHAKYRELHWRAAHWAMKRDIPPLSIR